MSEGREAISKCMGQDNVRVTIQFCYAFLIFFFYFGFYYSRNWKRKIGADFLRHLTTKKVSKDHIYLLFMSFIMPNVCETFA